MTVHETLDRLMLDHKIEQRLLMALRFYKTGSMWAYGNQVDAAYFRYKVYGGSMTQVDFKDTIKSFCEKSVASER